MAALQRSTLRSQWLGQELRQLREAKGVLLKEAAEYLQRDTGTVSRYETGFYPIRRPDLLALLDLYGVSDRERREALLRLSADVWQKGWWDGYSGDVVGTLIDYVWLEARATHIRSFAAIVIPGLLQTPEYAEALIRTNDRDATPEQIERWHELRMARQQVLDGDEPSRLSVILDESVLRRQISTPEIMAAQLRRLVECAARQAVDIRVLPFRAGTPAGTYGTFEIFELPDPFPEVAYAETMAGALYVEAPDTEPFFRTYDGHKNLALGPADSIELITAITEEWQ
ncbi:helix-turn-helix domain-containing protein [Thermomonospora umbrina]|uniref:Helix-turn-helix protein n=1 Tax=Thermomonospora umbrina TaxID=111806 RepID=A0A3D9T4I9_9ACTN|nr:helix-turn-helix transcriptional regulator [Thermomonospora umbrina]REE98731.1 helix-turn-helix protein [Thermomonospora umbrina]